MKDLELILKLFRVFYLFNNANLINGIIHQFPNISKSKLTIKLIGMYPFFIAYYFFTYVSTCLISYHRKFERDTSSLCRWTLCFQGRWGTRTDSWHCKSNKWAGRPGNHIFEALESPGRSSRWDRRCSPRKFHCTRLSPRRSGHSGDLSSQQPRHNWVSSEPRGKWTGTSPKWGWFTL